MAMSGGLMQRPIFGGAFGTGKYFLATMPCVSKGLHTVRFMVDPRAGSVLSVAEQKTEALASARRLLRATEALVRREAQEAASEPKHAKLWAEDTPATSEAGAPIRQTPRRRREIFAKSEGRCHYCSTALSLDGKWHVEHQMPRALGGGDGLPNLVAACVSCNLSKRDQTAVEFTAKRGRAM